MENNPVGMMRSQKGKRRSGICDLSTNICVCAFGYLLPTRKHTPLAYKIMGQILRAGMNAGDDQESLSLAHINTRSCRRCDSQIGSELTKAAPAWHQCCKINFILLLLLFTVKG
jgi:hypothetical protein